MTTPPNRSRALDWPEEWARDEKFWREVATRTIAGVAAIVIVGAPSLTYLWLAGQLSADTVFPILIAMGMLGVLALLWWVTRKIVRAVERRTLQKAVREDENVASEAAPPTDADVETAIQAFLRRRQERGDPFGEELEASFRRTEGSIYDILTDSTKSRMARIGAGAAFLGILAPALGAVAAVVAGFFIVR